MRILQIGKYYSPFKGGMERVLQDLSEGLCARGHHVRALVAANDRTKSHELLGGIEVVRLETWGSVLSQPLLRNLSDEVKSYNPDLVHLHLPNPLAAFLMPRLQIPFCITVHASPHGALKSFVDHHLSRISLQRASAIVFASRSLMETWSAKHPISSTFTVIPFGLRNKFPHEEISREPNLALFVGRLVPYKGLGILIEAISRSSARLVIIGDGPEKNRLKNQVQALGLQNRITFLGQVDDHELQRWYRRARIFVLPSISQAEGFGLSMLEAMRAGTPVISTDLPTGVREVNLHMRTGLVVPPSDARRLSSALNSLITAPALAAELGRGAYKHSFNYSHSVMIDRHESLYFHLCEGRAIKSFSAPEITLSH